jgi:hypothetical protein
MEAFRKGRACASGSRPIRSGAMKKRTLSGVCVMSILAVSSVANCASVATDLPVGSAKGSLNYDGATVELKFAAAFVDQKDERKPVVLVMSDRKPPVEEWDSESDMISDHSKWSGVVFFLDKAGKSFRYDVRTNGRQTRVSGIFEFNVENSSSKDLTGTAKTTANEKETKLDAAFHVTLTERLLRTTAFWREIFDFLSGDKASLEDYHHKYFYFAVACGFIGLVVVIFDFIFTKVSGTSLLNLGYLGIGKTVFLIVFWGLGAGIGGYLAAISEIVHMNIKGCGFIGVGWPFVLPRLISSAREQTEDEQEPGN